MLVSRQIEFLKLILNENKYRPIKYFKDKLNVSDKTLQKDLKIIERYLETFNIKIDIKRGYGILIEALAKKNIDLINSLNIQPKTNKSLSVEQRRMEILKYLLLNSSNITSINQLADKYYVSKTSIVNDFKYIETWIKEYNLKLNKTLEGTKIIGKEVDIRKSIAKMMDDLLDENYEQHDISELTRLDSATFSALRNLFDIDSIIFVETIITELENNLGYTISQPYYINLITHILICLKRIKEGNQIESQKEREVSVDNLDELVYQNVTTLIGKIENRYRVKITKDEIMYIYIFLVSSGFSSESNSSYNAESDILGESEKLSSIMIENMSQFLNINLKNDDLLQKSLASHVRPMLNRLRYDIQIKNPLLGEIQERFSDVLGLCMMTINIMAEHYNLNNISIDEVSYLATYFQAAIERTMSSKRVIVVCHTGYGTSQLLAARLKREFPEWTIVDIIPMHQLNKRNLDDVDFVISTVNLDLKDKLHIVVSVLLMESDINNIKNALVTKPKESMNLDTNLLGMYLKDNIYFNFDVIQMKSLIGMNLSSKYKSISLGKDLNIYIYNQSKLNKGIMNINNINRTIDIYLETSNQSFLKNILIEVSNLYRQKNYINYLIDCKRKEDVKILFDNNALEKINGN
ncbi:BglG family transcription antiterminator [Clostridioides difficile]|nr:antitermination protein BlgG [Clostridioides difficile]